MICNVSTTLLLTTAYARQTHIAGNPTQLGRPGGAHLGSVLDALCAGSAGGVVHGVLVSAGDVLLDVMAGLHRAQTGWSRQQHVKTAYRHLAT